MFIDLVGYSPESIGELTIDFNETDKFLPHPICGAYGWVAVVSPGPRTPPGPGCHRPIPRLMNPESKGRLIIANHDGFTETVIGERGWRPWQCTSTNGLGAQGVRLSFSVGERDFESDGASTVLTQSS